MSHSSHRRLARWPLRARLRSRRRLTPFPQQLRELQVEVSASLAAKASLSSLHSITRLPPRATSASPTPSLSSLQAQLASQATDLVLASTLGTALSEKNDFLERCIKDLAARLAALDPPPASPPSTSTDSSSASDDSSDLARLRVQLQRAIHRQQLTETHYKDALATAKKQRREAVERLRTVQRDTRLRETQLTAQSRALDEQLRRASEELDRLHASDADRLSREKAVRRSLELRERSDEEERRRWNEAREEYDRGLDDLDRRHRDEYRRREEAERRCLQLEKQRDEAVAGLHEATLEMERRKRRWEELDKARARSMEEEMDRHRHQATALVEQCHRLEERVRQAEEERDKTREDGKQKQTPVTANGVHHAFPMTPASAVSSLSSSFLSPSQRGPLASPMTQTPLDWLRKGEGAPMSERSLGQMALNFAIVSPGPDGSLPITPSTALSILSPAPLDTTPEVAPSQAVAAKFHKFNTFSRRLSEEEEEEEEEEGEGVAHVTHRLPSIPSGTGDIVEADHAALEIVSNFSLVTSPSMQPIAAQPPSTGFSISVTPMKPTSLAAYVASPLSYLQPQQFKNPALVSQSSPLTKAMAKDSTPSSPLSLSSGPMALQAGRPSSLRGFLLSGPSPVPAVSSTLFQVEGAERRQSSLGRGSASNEVRQVFSTLLHTRLGQMHGARGAKEVKAAVLSSTAPAAPSG